ncbi:MAG: gliding motility-associated C-terminal domain-containing protein [Flavobacteriia bacterium]|nr:gliding motility-associated C-terminal domain-containing protein [Flavobacteriia bacterium]
MGDKDLLKDIFSEKLKDLELPVNENLWTSISSQIPTAASSTATGISVLSKIIIGSSITAATIVGAYLITTNSQTTVKPTKTQNSIQNIENKIQIEDQKIITNNLQHNQTTVANNNKDNIGSICILPTVPNILLINNPINIISNETSIPQITNENNISSSTTHIEENKEEQKVLPAKDEFIHPKQNKIEEYTIKLTNVFSPNNDGTNDLFFIESEGLNDFSIVIMDQTNKTVFTSEDPNFKWDGINLNGDLVNSGTYIYFILAKSKAGEVVKKYQTLDIKH